MTLTRKFFTRWLVMFLNAPTIFIFFCLIALSSYTKSDSGTRHWHNNANKSIPSEIHEALDCSTARNIAVQPNLLISTWRWTLPQVEIRVKRASAPTSWYGNSVCTFYPVLLLIYNIELNPAEPSSSSGKTPKNRKVNITIAHLNVCSIASHKKFFLVKQMIVHGNYDIFVISESWLDPSLTNNDIQIPGYVIFRQDRSPHKSGGGIVVYIRNSIKALTIDNWSTTVDTNSQHLWLKV